MTHKVSLTYAAAEDAEDAYAWIAKDAPQAAVDWYNGLLDAIESLRNLPNRCPLAREATALRRDVRQLHDRNYRVLFVVDGEVVRVLRVWHGARDDLRPSDLRDDRNE